MAPDGHWYGDPATARGLDAFLDFFPKDSGWNWTVLASWASLFTAAHTVLERGGNLSIGLGDYHYRQGAEKPTNAQLVERAVRVAAKVGRKPATRPPRPERSWTSNNSARRRGGAVSRPAGRGRPELAE